MEIAIDTNVLVRLFINDDERQHQAAVTLCEQSDLFVSDTVLLETEWVLRGVYEIPRSNINKVFSSFVAKENVTLNDSESIHSALQWHAEGMDFADALHLAKAQPRQFFSFDRTLVKRAKKAGLKVQSP